MSEEKFNELGEYEPQEVKLFTIELRMDEYANFFVEQYDVALNELADFGGLPMAELTEAYAILTEARAKVATELERVFKGYRT